MGDGAGFLNVPKIKGTHTAMKSGMLAAEAAFAALAVGKDGAEAKGYRKTLRESWVGRELRRERNIRPAFRWGLWPGMIYSALETYVLRGCAPWTLRHRADHESLKPAANVPPSTIPPPTAHSLLIG